MLYEVITVLLEDLGKLRVVGQDRARARVHEDRPELAEMGEAGENLGIVVDVHPPGAPAKAHRQALLRRVRTKESYNFV